MFSRRSVSTLAIAIALLFSACSASSSGTEVIGTPEQSAASVEEAGAEAETPEPAVESNEARDEATTESDPASESVETEEAASVAISGVSFDEAVATFGPLEAEWVGPLTEEYVCNNMPHQHALAVLTNVEDGKQIVYERGYSCELWIGHGKLRVRAEDAKSAESYDIQVRNMFGNKDDREPIDGLGNRATIVSNDRVQQLVIDDATQMWTIDGPGAEYLPDAHFVEFAEVVLARFTPETRVDAVPEPMTGDALVAITALIEDYGDTLNGIAVGDLDINALTDSYMAEHEATKRAESQVKFPRLHEFEILRADRLNGTSAGDVIELHLCERHRDAVDETRSPSYSDPIVTIDANSDDWRITDWNSRRSMAAAYCEEPDFLETDAAEKAANRAETVAASENAAPETAPSEEPANEAGPSEEPATEGVDRGDDVDAYVGVDLTRADFEVMNDEQLHAVLMDALDVTGGLVSQDSMVCFADWMTAEVDRATIAEIHLVGGQLPAGEMRDRFGEAQVECGIVTDLIVALVIFNEAELAEEDSICLGEVLTTKEFAQDYLAASFEDPLFGPGSNPTQEEINEYMVELAGC